ncbi:ABC transporter permease [Microlunatus soli]|uniref:Monosaccharide ABC transporter membrane protein, CUT2 family n=1 Tax=Microlunatus soli TaxID=630515 RepID=A0A1H1YZX0_9ACTN|nr:ABC transporter permease [Microlunatus soli]SDT26963.1 monosaccharide ABC transporter membrane protein, CUT2 family [Microlunatus soli]
MTELGVDGGARNRLAQLRQGWCTRLASLSVLLGMVVVLIMIEIARPLFLTGGNLAAIAVDATVLIVIAAGLSLVMGMRGIDLSIVAVADLSGYLAASLLLSGSSFTTAVLAALVAALLVGIINGLLAGYLGVPAIVATLAMNLLVTAAVLVLSDNGTPQQLFTAPLELVRPMLIFGSDSWGPFRLLVVVAVIVVAVIWFLSRRTVWSRRAELVNANARAADLSAAPVRATFAIGFVLSGLLAGVAGIMLTARTGLAVPGSAEPFLLEAFSAVYLGSIAAPSGRVRVLWTVVGAIFVTMLGNGLVLLGLGAEWRYVLNGMLILVALTLGLLRRRSTR